MKFYLSSYKIGNEKEKLRGLIGNNKKIGFIDNASDFTGHDPKKRKDSTKEVMRSIEELGIEVEQIDLRDYFGKKEELQKKIDGLGGIFIKGGNTFVLRQAMKISGLDEILKNMKREDFLYAGYSAGGCVLSKRLDYLQIVDNPNDFPYKEINETIWEGLGLIDFAFLPHYKSDHPESSDIDKELEYCKENNIPFKALRDGEVLIIE